MQFATCMRAFPRTWTKGVAEAFSSASQKYLGKIIATGTTVSIAQYGGHYRLGVVTTAWIGNCLL